MEKVRARVEFQGDKEIESMLMRAPTKEALLVQVLRLGVLKRVMSIIFLEEHDA